MSHKHLHSSSKRSLARWICGALSALLLLATSGCCVRLWDGCDGGYHHHGGGHGCHR